MTYHASEPLVTVFNKIEELQCLAEVGENTYSDRQKIQIGICIITNSNNFKDCAHMYLLGITIEVLRRFSGSIQNSEAPSHAASLMEPESTGLLWLTVYPHGTRRLNDAGSGLVHYYSIIKCQIEARKFEL